MNFPIISRVLQKKPAAGCPIFLNFQCPASIELLGIWNLKTKRSQASWKSFFKGTIVEHICLLPCCYSTVLKTSKYGLIYHKIKNKRHLIVKWMPILTQKSYIFCNRIKCQVLLVILMVVRKVPFRHLQGLRLSKTYNLIVTSILLMTFKDKQQI